MIAREQVAAIIGGLVDPLHPQHPGDLRVFRADPIRSITSIARHEGIALSRMEAELLASVLVYPVTLRTLYLLESTRESETSVRSALAVLRPTLRLAVLMQGSVVLLGLALVVSSLWASIRGEPALAATLGAVGLTSFTGVFLTQPFDDLYRSLRRRVRWRSLPLAIRSSSGCGGRTRSQPSKVTTMLASTPPSSRVSPSSLSGRWI